MQHKPGIKLFEEKSLQDDVYDSWNGNIEELVLGIEVCALSLGVVCRMNSRLLSQWYIQCGTFTLNGHLGEFDCENFRSRWL